MPQENIKNLLQTEKKESTKYKEAEKVIANDSIQRVKQETINNEFALRMIFQYGTNRKINFFSSTLLAYIRSTGVLPLIIDDTSIMGMELPFWVPIVAVSIFAGVNFYHLYYKHRLNEEISPKFELNKPVRKAKSDEEMPLIKTDQVAGHFGSKNYIKILSYLFLENVGNVPACAWIIKQFFPGLSLKVLAIASSSISLFASSGSLRSEAEHYLNLEGAGIVSKKKKDQMNATEKKVPTGKTSITEAEIESAEKTHTFTTFFKNVEKQDLIKAFVLALLSGCLITKGNDDTGDHFGFKLSSPMILGCLLAGWSIYYFAVAMNIISRSTLLKKMNNLLPEQIEAQNPDIAQKIKEKKVQEILAETPKTGETETSAALPAGPGQMQQMAINKEKTPSMEQVNVKLPAPPGGVPNLAASTKSNNSSSTAFYDPGFSESSQRRSNPSDDNAGSSPS